MWTFDDLTIGGTYQVLVTWVADSTHASAAEYTVSHGSVTENTVDEDQRVDLNTDANAVEFDGHQWRSIGEFTVTDSEMTVALGNDDTGVLIADAVYVVRKAPVTSYAYDRVGNTRTVTDAENNTTTFEYDDLDRKITLVEQDPDGAGSQLVSETEYRYDVASQLREMSDPLDRVTSFDYDQQGRRTVTTRPDPDGAGAKLAPKMTYTYDAVGNVLTEVNRIDATTDDTTTYVYDHLNRQVKNIDANGDFTVTTYDIASRIKTFTDPVDNVTSYKYDDLDRQTEDKITVSSVDLTRTSKYDLVGNTKIYKDRNDRIIKYTYDDLYRQEKEEWFADTSDTTADHTLDYTWDIASRMTAAEDVFASYAYKYDGLDRLTRETHVLHGPNSESLDTVVLNHKYDLVHNRESTAAQIDGVDDFFTDYQYDKLYRMTGVVQNGQTGGNTVADKRVDLTYDVAHQMDLVKRYADTTGTELVAESNYDWDLASRLTDLAYTDAALATLADYNWSHDARDRVMSFDSSNDGDATYDYDDRGQLTDADYDYQTDEDYAYDENGNRTDHRVGDHNRVSSDGTYSYLWDGEGNMIRRTHIANDTVTVYEWDHRNRLISITEYADTTDADLGTDALKRVDQVYDIQDRWIGRFVDSDGDGSGVTETDDTWFVYDGDQIIYEFEATTGDGDGSQAMLDNRYLWGPNRDQLLASEEDANNETTWTLTDNLGSIRDLVTYDDVLNETSSVDHFVYDAFGKIDAESGFLFQYTARPFDNTTGLQNNSARWYNLELHFWYSADPGGFAMGDANLYRYVGNGPTNATDPEGLEDAELTRAPNINILVENRLPMEWRKSKDPDAGVDLKREVIWLSTALKQNQSKVYEAILHEDVGWFVYKYTWIADMDFYEPQVTQAFSNLTVLSAAHLTGTGFNASTFEYDTSKEGKVHGTKTFRKVRKFFDAAKAKDPKVKGKTIYATLEASGGSVVGISYNYVKGWWSITVNEDFTTTGRASFGVTEWQGVFRGDPDWSEHIPDWWPKDIEADWNGAVVR